MYIVGKQVTLPMLPQMLTPILSIHFNTRRAPYRNPPATACRRSMTPVHIKPIAVHSAPLRTRSSAQVCLVKVARQDAAPHSTTRYPAT